MKAVETIKRIGIGILGVIFFSFVIAMTVLLLNFNEYGVTQFDDTSLVIINSSISSDKYKKGDLVFVKQQKLSNIKVGDEIFTYKIEKNRSVSIDLGKVGEVYEDEDSIAFENGNTYAEEYVIGKADKVYNKIGGYLSIIQSKWGFLFIVIIPSFLIFIYELYAIIIEIKYGKEEA